MFYGLRCLAHFTSPLGGEVGPFGPGEGAFLLAQRQEKAPSPRLFRCQRKAALSPKGRGGDSPNAAEKPSKPVDWS
jgi:hypothetical protein